MANQWGRDGNFQTAGSKSSSIILPILISLILGVAGGYGGFRMLSGVSESEITDRDRRIAELEKTISDLRFDDGGDTAALNKLKSENTQLQRRLDDADAEIESLAKENSRLSQNPGQAGSVELELARREIEALERTLEEAGDLRNELARAKNSLQMSEVQIIELEKEVSDQNRKIKALEKQLAGRPADAGDEAADRIRDLVAENRNLAASLDRQQKDTRKARADLAALAQKLGSATEQNKTLMGEIDSLISRNKQLSAEMAALKQRLAETGGKNADFQEITAKNAKLEAELAKLADRIKKREAEFATIRSANDALKSQIEGLNKKLEQARSGEANGQTPGDATQPVTTGAAPRDPVQVEQALNRMPGLDRLDAEKQAILRAKLEEGACVTNSLEAVFDRVPVLALRNLMRDLRSPC